MIQTGTGSLVLGAGGTSSTLNGSSAADIVLTLPATAGTLLLANGSHPFVPPLTGAEKTGVFTLRSLDDLKTILAYLKDKERVVVIGGGLLGIEAAHGLVELGKTVNVLEFFQYLLPRQLDPELSHTVQKQLEKEGLQFALGAGCEEILGTESVEGIKLRHRPGDQGGYRHHISMRPLTSLTFSTRCAAPSAIERLLSAHRRCDRSVLASRELVSRGAMLAASIAKLLIGGTHGLIFEAFLIGGIFT